MKCPHTKTRRLYEQRPPSEGRKLRAVANKCEACGALFSIEFEEGVKHAVEEHRNRKRVPSLGDHILEKMRQGVPLEGVYDPKKGMTSWRLGPNSIHALAIRKLVEKGLLRIDVKKFPFTNGRIAFLIEAGAEA